MAFTKFVQALIVFTRWLSIMEEPVLVDRTTTDDMEYGTAISAVLVWLVSVCFKMHFHASSVSHPYNVCCVIRNQTSTHSCS